ncbi:hypothetical protein AGMMS50243_21960 [Betaproteobacteria bacterium]|nr:hypothetical protein AGMMS50243_21960 [Betaproteobacteria bacterium]
MAEAKIPFPFGSIPQDPNLFSDAYSPLYRMGCTRCTFTAQTAKAQTRRGLQESTPTRDPHHARIFPRRGFSPQQLRRQEYPKQQQRQEPETDIEGF